MDHHRTDPEMDRRDLTNHERLQRLVSESGCAAVLANSFENVTYTSGYYYEQMKVMPDRMHLVVLPREGEAVLIQPSYSTQTNSFLRERRGYDFYARDEVVSDARGAARVTRSAIPTLAELVGERGWEGSRIGFEEAHFPAGRYKEMCALLPQAELVDCGSLFTEARMVKTRAEIDLLQDASIVTLRAVESGFLLARPGDTLRSVGVHIAAAMAHVGAEHMPFMELDVLSEGKRYGHLGEPHVLQAGDLLRIDAGGLFAGYYSDIARVAMIGKATPQQRSGYNRLRGVQMEIIHNVIKPGLEGRELYRRTADVFRKAGFKAPWGMIVHGIGLYLHERPWFRETETYALLPGTVLAVEAYFHAPDGKIEQQIEDLVLVTATGAEVLSTAFPTEEPLVLS